MVQPSLTTCSQYWGTALPEGAPCPGGLAGPSLSSLTPISLTFIAPAPLQGPFHSGATPHPISSGATPKLHMASSSWQDPFNLWAPGCLLPHLALLPGQTWQSPHPGPQTITQSSQSSSLRSSCQPSQPQYFIWCPQLFKGDLLDTSTLSKTKSQCLPPK